MIEDDMPTFPFQVLTPVGDIMLGLDKGESLFFVGANGSGKTRLAVKIEESLGLTAHRISAHRALSLNLNLSKVSERIALKGLRTGHASDDAIIAHRSGSRWEDKAPIKLLNDFDYLLQALFADQANVHSNAFTKRRGGDMSEPEQTRFEKLVAIWEKVMPTKQLEITGDNIQVKLVGTTETYSASQMSDGERATFYLIGQTLCADLNSVLIVDEPELHVHRSIMSKLWDQLEAARPDCAFIFITHDLDFAASRIGQKFVIRDYNPATGWAIEPVPEATGFSEDITTQILGSRRPILFVEGEGNSLDLAIYRNCYPEWTVIPRGSCENVIHSVTTMRNNSDLTRVTCSGIVDADDRTASEISHLATLNVSVLPVSEIENLLLLPQIVQAIGQHEGNTGVGLQTKIDALNAAIIANVQHGTNLQDSVMRYCLRRIDRTLKRIDLSDAISISDLATKYITETSTLNIADLGTVIQNKITGFLAAGNIAGLMTVYDNKGLVALVAREMKATKAQEFEGWLMRILGSKTAPLITSAFIAVLPTPVAR